MILLRFTVANLLCGSVAAAQWSVVNLTPSNASMAEVYAVSPSAQYGGARRTAPPTNVQPGLWRGSAASFASIGPPEMNAIIFASDGATHGGVWSGHATVWRGSPPVATDLHTGGWETQVRAIGGDRQFGWTRATSGSQESAAMWSGSAASYVNMNPPGSISSSLRAAAGNRQAGSAAFSGTGGRAGIWSGTPQSYTNIHPAGAWTTRGSTA
jgi:hypothetical protein